MVWIQDKAIRTAPMLNQPVKEVWPICQVDVQIGKKGNAAPVGLYASPNQQRAGRQLAVARCGPYGSGVQRG